MPQRLACLLLALLVGGWPVWPAAAGRLTTRHAPLLLIDVWCSTDASGQVTDLQQRMRLTQPGSTQAGLVSSWSMALERTLDDRSLTLTPLPWIDAQAELPAPPGADWLTASIIAAGRSAPRLPGMPGTQASPPDLSWHLPGAPRGVIVQATLADLQAAADRHLRTQAPALVAALTPLLRGEGADQAWLAWHQQVQFSGAPVQLVWNLHVLGNGYWAAGSPQIQAQGSRSLAARYVSRTAATGLPAETRYPEAGLLQWQLRDAEGQPTGTLQREDLGGAFDGSTGLACLLGEAGATQCVASALPFSLPALASRLGAVQIELDYLDALQPAYAASPDGSRAAIVQLQVTRVLEGQGADCSLPPWRYQNDYQAAFQLLAQRQHYSRVAGRPWWHAPAQQSLVSGTLLPWRSVTVPLQADQRAQVANLLVDPERGTLVDLARFSGGVQRVEATPVRCQPR